MSGPGVIPEQGWHRVAREIDALLADHHQLRAALKAPHPPLLTTIDGRLEATPVEVGVKHYGVGPLLALWIECRRVEALRLAWTGSPTVAAEIPPPPPVPPVEEPVGPDEAAVTPADARGDGPEGQRRLRGMH